MNDKSVTIPIRVTDEHYTGGCLSDGSLVLTRVIDERYCSRSGGGAPPVFIERMTSAKAVARGDMRPVFNKGN